MNINNLFSELRNLSSPEKAKKLSVFFKTGKGEYGEGDTFIGVKVPEQRKIAKKYVGIEFQDVKRLIKSKIHEHRLTGFFILVYKYSRADEKAKKKIFDFYIENKEYVNNWDIVDTTAPNIIGGYLLDKDRKMLYDLARSEGLWDKRIAMLSCYTFIKNNDFDDALRISEILLLDKHDLIQKAVGWMLREIGNKDMETEEFFLKKHYKHMPRTMLRYAIEKFPKDKRKFYMEK